MLYHEVDYKKIDRQVGTAVRYEFLIEVIEGLQVLGECVAYLIGHSRFSIFTMRSFRSPMMRAVTIQRSS